jgi:hypothetical protein
MCVFFFSKTELFLAFFATKSEPTSHKNTLAFYWSLDQFCSHIELLALREHGTATKNHLGEPTKNHSMANRFQRKGCKKWLGGNKLIMGGGWLADHAAFHPGVCDFIPSVAWT